MSKVRKTKLSTKKAESPFRNYWSTSNQIIFVAGLVVILLGFLLMNQYPWDNPLSMTYSPIVLLIAYIIIFPVAIFYKKKHNPEK
jgi:cell division protein FtsW (lipid II flippase)